MRRRQWWEESIFLVGTPQCLLAEGLADLGLEVVMGRRPEAVVAEHLRPLGIRYDAEVVAAVAEAGEALGAVRQNAAFRLHEDGADPDTVTAEVARWGLLLARPGGQGGRVPHPPDLAGLPHLLRRGPAAVPQLRGRRPGPVRPAALRAADPRRAGGADPGRPCAGGCPGRTAPPRSHGSPDGERTSEGRRDRSLLSGGIDPDTADSEVALDAAAACYLRLGVAGTTATDIAREAGISRATLYRRYGSHEAIFLAVLHPRVRGHGGGRPLPTSTRLDRDRPCPSEPSRA